MITAMSGTIKAARIMSTTIWYQVRSCSHRQQIRDGPTMMKTLRMITTKGVGLLLVLLRLFHPYQQLLSNLHHPVSGAISLPHLGQRNYKNIKFCLNFRGCEQHSKLFCSFDELHESGGERKITKQIEVSPVQVIRSSLMLDKCYGLSWESYAPNHWRKVWWCRKSKWNYNGIEFIWIVK